MLQYEQVFGLKIPLLNYVSSLLIHPEVPSARIVLGFLVLVSDEHLEIQQLILVHFPLKRLLILEVT